MSITYDMFDRERTEREAKAAHLLERIYHKGHSKGWDGKAVLKELLEKHDGIDISPEKVEALGAIFSMILWGELAAWKVSASLAFDIEPMEAKMAATSQAHDEARHFYVMHDYLKELNYFPKKLNRSTEILLNNIIESDTLAKKLLGMHLMVEPIAITIFRFVRELDIEPVLSELLVLYERDEARHIALGIQYLPELIKEMSFIEKIRLIVFQIKILSLEVDGLRSLESSFENLGIDPQEVFKFAEKKQMEALTELAGQVGMNDALLTPLVRAINMQKDLAFSKEPYHNLIYKVATLLRGILLGA
jgi:hypothetical protein